MVSSPTRRYKIYVGRRTLYCRIPLSHQPSSNGIAERMVGMLKTTVRRMLKQANLGRERWSYASRFAGHMMREKALGREWTHPLFGQLVGIRKSHDKTQAKSLDDRGSVGYLLDIDIWQSGTTRIMQDGVVIKGLAPRRLDPCRYHLNPGTDLSELEQGMPWRSVQDEFGKFKWIGHVGRIYHGTPFSVEPDITSKHVFIASMMHTSSRLQYCMTVPMSPVHPTFQTVRRERKLFIMSRFLIVMFRSAEGSMPMTRSQML